VDNEDTTGGYWVTYNWNLDACKKISFHAYSSRREVLMLNSKTSVAKQAYKAPVSFPKGKPGQNKNSLGVASTISRQINVVG
jgi:hypothetical protein